MCVSKQLEPLPFNTSSKTIHFKFHTADFHVTSASFHEICFHLKLSHASTSCGVQSSEVIFDENVDQCQIAQLLNKAGGRSPRELFGDLKCCLTGRTKN